MPVGFSSKTYPPESNGFLSSAAALWLARIKGFVFKWVAPGDWRPGGKSKLPKKQVPLNRPDLGIMERLAVDAVLRSGALAQGKKVAEFESAFSATVAGRNSIAVNSGTSALHLSLLALGIGPGDEVIVPSFTFAASANAVAITGATPVFVDIEPDYFSIDPLAVQSAITPRTKAVIAVHLYGHPARMAELRKICDSAGILLVEDAAQAHLAQFEKTPVGAWGAMAAFSFYPTKNMTTGEGGMSVTGDEAVARRVRLLRNQGMERRYENEIPGFNNRMTEVAAAIGLVQLQKLAGWTKKRQSNAAFLDENLNGVVVPKVHSLASHVYHQYTIKVEGHDRSQFAAELKKLGVDSDIYYPAPVHKLPAYGLTHSLEVTEQITKSCLSIPVHQKLSASDLSKIVSAVNKLAKAGA
jgi:dTDP-4-amino-4,6-dideoxygalactose transaminase